VHLTRLALTDFRSYPELSIELGAGVTTFSGPNGEGKTKKRIRKQKKAKIRRENIEGESKK
jgi:predicted ATP-binding protein involved in virulence